MLKLKLLIISCLLISLAACGGAAKSMLSAGGIKKPEVKIESVTVTKISLFQVNLSLQLAVVNPNKFAFVIDKIDYTVKVYEQLLASASQQEVYNVGAEARQIINIPVNLEMKNLRKVMNQFKLNEVPYTVDAKIGVSVAGMKSLNVPVSKSGSLNLLEKLGL